MASFLAEYGLFLAKTLTVLGAVLVVLAAVVAARARMRPGGDGHIEVRKLNERFDAMRDALRAASLEPRELRKRLKAEHKADKARRKTAAASAGAAAKRVFVLSFHGDLRAHAVDALREEISAVLTQAGEGDSVLLRLESGGGLVHAYGLAAAQLARIRERGIPLTACVDKVAASGGYLMACVADRIVAAPFALLGSIGVVAQIPNFHRLLRRHDIDYELFTAGQYKRTLTVFGRNTEAGRQKFAAEIEDTHALFKEYVARFRPALEIERVATGEAWFGQRALELGLVDALGTSDALLQEAAADAELIEVRYVERRKLGERLGLSLEGAIARGIARAIERAGSREDWLR